ncbi:MAG: MarR family transcriptional regulator [Oscillospiraceae bacterium]|jgi:Mn-dependent DtxR family transcriptional regulator|nr:MarR family transcriptional regulator [Oscillospiraceae bacterium]
MAELREAHLRYLLAIYELSRSKPDVGIQAVAKALNCSKASVTKMMANLIELNLLVRERYGKIYLTDTGFLLAKDLLRCVEIIQERLPAMGFDLTVEETADLVHTVVVNLPEHSRKRLAGRE